jgi:hypothetical protein
MEAFRKGGFSIDDIEAEKKEIMETYLSMRFMKTFRQSSVSCFSRCSGKIGFPFVVEPAKLIGKQELCFGDCMNINLERGPYLKDLGDVPEESIPVKFVWPNTIDEKLSAKKEE